MARKYKVRDVINLLDRNGEGGYYVQFPTSNTLMDWIEVESNSFIVDALADYEVDGIGPYRTEDISSEAGLFIYLNFDYVKEHSLKFWKEHIKKEDSNYERNN